VHLEQKKERERRNEAPAGSGKWRDFKTHVAEFGENVWYLKAASAGRDKLERRWEEGVWLGIKDESGRSW
jgi:hypothetical protein